MSIKKRREPVGEGGYCSRNKKHSLVGREKLLWRNNGCFEGEGGLNPKQNPSSNSMEFHALASPMRGGGRPGDLQKVNERGGGL